jgi:putative RecB family exonuclease
MGSEEPVDVIVDDSRSTGLPAVWSPSSVNTFIKCPLSYWFTYAQGWRPAPNAVLLAGTLVHGVLEELLALDPADRTIERARAIYTAHGEALEPELDQRVNRIELRERSGVALRNYFEVEDPAEIEVVPDGLERKVKATIAGVDIAGTIDRVQFADGGVRVLDYKTGGAKPQYAAAYWRQLLLYTQMLTDEGIDVADVALMFIGDPPRTLVRPVPSAARTRTANDLATAAEQRAEYDEQSRWQARPSVLCRYCPFRTACPSFSDRPVAIPGTEASHRTLQNVRDLVLRPAREPEPDLVGDPEVSG